MREGLVGFREAFEALSSSKSSALVLINSRARLRETLHILRKIGATAVALVWAGCG